MPRLSPKMNTIRSLFAKSGNQCAFPGCQNELVDKDNEFIAQICHIAAANEGGERFDPSMTDEERREYDNLVLLCYPHHVKTNNVRNYSVKSLTEMKKSHENKFKTSPFNIPEETIRSIVSDQLQFSNEIRAINREHLKELEVSLEVSFDSNPQIHSKKIEESTKYLEDLLDQVDRFLSSFHITNFGGVLGHSKIGEHSHEHRLDKSSPLQDVLWEERHIGGSNSLQKIRVNLLALVLHAEIGRILADPSDETTRLRIAEIQENLRNQAATSTVVD